MKEYIIKIDEDKKDIMGNCSLVEKPQELVRCKDCKYWHETIYDTPKWMPCMSVQTSGNWFCADGVKKHD